MENREDDFEFEYMLLSRLQSDCEYFLNYGKGSENALWAGNVSDQISKMLELWDILPVKPEWLTRAQILDYADRMQNYQKIA